MFFATLILAGIQLGAAAVVFQIARGRTVGRFLMSLAGGFLGMVLLTAVSISPAVFLQGVVLFVIGIICVSARARQSVFLGSAFVASIAAIGIVGQKNVNTWARHKERYPFQSVAARLNYEPRAIRRAEKTTLILKSPGLPGKTVERLEEGEQWRSWNYRSHALGLVHASYVDQFVTTPGFGVGRMIRLSPEMIERGDKRGRVRMPLNQQPDHEGTPEQQPEITAPVGERPVSESSIAGPLAQLHKEAWHDFLDPEGFGYFRDKEHVAGFVSHSFFQNQPRLFSRKSKSRWLTVRVELVSMLKHERPMVYVSKNLPNMNELRHVPVRELDAFEQQALTSLIEGEDLVSNIQPGRIRALGSLRAMRQCLQCHEVERGTLLGAFSYEFLRDTPLPKKAEPADDDLATLEYTHLR